MPTKPFSLQSPEQIAKDYGGNKQKIAQAAQSGLLDPTAAVMAGMFIDRMRSAQTQEQGPPTTVAQQVFAPPQPPQGAPPPMMGQPGMAPPMGAPMPPPPPAAPPMGAPPVGMASGGLTALPLPDNMFDEPDGMGYAGGGIVAFAEGGLNSVVPPPQVDAYGRPLSLQGNMALIDQLMGPAPDKYAAEQERYYEQLRSPEAQAARKKQDLWGSLAQIGFGMAGSNSPYFLQAAGQAGAAALPGMQAAAKDRRMEQQQALDRLAGIEGQRYNAKGQRVQSALSMQGQSITAAEAEKARAEGKRQFDEQLAFEKQKAKDQLALGYAGVNASRAGGGAERLTDRQRLVQATFGRLRADPAMRGKSDATLLGMAEERASMYGQGVGYDGSSADGSDPTMPDILNRGRGGAKPSYPGYSARVISPAGD